MIYLWGNSFCTQMFPFRGNQILYLNAFIYGNIFCNWMFSFKGKLILDLNIFIYREINFVSGCSHLQENTRAWPIIGLRPVSDRPLQGIESQIILFNLQLKHTSLYKTSQELRMLSRSLFDCKSLLLNVKIQVLQFVSYSQPCH